MTPITVLFTSAGRRAELINCFREDAAALSVPFRALAADMHPEFSAACRLADKYFKVPRCTDANYVPSLLDICAREKVRLIVPTIDTELEVLAAHQFPARVHISSLEVVRMARNKAATTEFLNQAGIPTPKTGIPADVFNSPNAWRWPLILKPIGGSSSVGIQIAHDLEEFKHAVAKREDYIIQEHWSGREFTVNIFFDQTGKLRCAIPHLRKETRTGEVSKGITWRHPRLMELAEKLGAALPGARGAMCFQAIVDDAGQAVVFEINARFGGGYPLAHRAGGKFSKWLMEEILARESTASNEWQDRLMMLRYDAAVFAPAPPEA